jgi:hypothetical protein
VKNAKQGAGLLFTGAEILANFHCNLCSNQWVKPPRAFGIFVEGNLLSNFGIQSLDHFYFKNWRKSEWEMVNSNWFWTRPHRARRHPRARHVGSPYPGRARTPRHQSTQRSEARAAATVQLGPMTRAGRPRPVTRDLHALAGGRTAIRHWPPLRRTSPPPPRPCLSSCRPRRCLAIASTRLEAINPPASFYSRARATRRHPPLASSVTLLLRSLPW